MTVTFHIILLVSAFLLFLAAGVGFKHPRIELIGLGLACWVASLLFT